MQAQLRTLLIAAKRCGAAAIVAALGSGSVGGPHRAITIPRTGKPIILYGNDRASTLTPNARIPHLAPDRLAAGSNFVGLETTSGLGRSESRITKNLVPGQRLPWWITHNGR